MPNKKQYNKRVQNHECTSCGIKLEQTHTKRKCTGCKDKENSKRHKHKLNNKCCHCGSPLIDLNYVYCSRCRSQHKKFYKKRTQKWKDEGKCIRCGIDLSIFSGANTAKYKCPICIDYRPLWS